MNLEMNTSRAMITPVKGRKSRMQRVAAPKSLRLTGSQQEVLQLLHEYGFLTPRLMALAYGSRKGREGRGYWHLQRELRRLFDGGLVQRFYGAACTVRRGSAECVYAITHQGGRAILDAQEYAAVRRDIYNREGKQRANFDHHIAVATLQLILVLGQSGWTLVDFRAEERNPRACIRVDVKDRVLTVWPDAAVVIDARAEESRRRTRYLFEIDLTRKSNQRVEDRFRAYGAYFQQRRAELGRSPSTRPLEELAVVFAVASENEVERFIEIAAGVVSSAPKAERPPFLFWNIQDWYAGQGTGRLPQAGGELRPAKSILIESRLAMIDGSSRQLVKDSTRY